MSDGQHRSVTRSPTTMASHRLDDTGESRRVKRQLTGLSESRGYTETKFRKEKNLPPLDGMGTCSVLSVQNLNCGGPVEIEGVRSPSI